LARSSSRSTRLRRPRQPGYVLHRCGRQSAVPAERPSLLFMSLQAACPALLHESDSAFVCAFLLQTLLMYSGIVAALYISNAVAHNNHLCSRITRTCRMTRYRRTHIVPLSRALLRSDHAVLCAACRRSCTAASLTAGARSPHFQGSERCPGPC
jgi:hypothetical protein